MLMEAKACAAASAAVCKRNSDFRALVQRSGFFSVYDKRDSKIYQNNRFFAAQTELD